MNNYIQTPTQSFLLRKARELAAKEHANQLYKPDRPYTDHLNAVENKLREFGINETNGPEDEEVLIAGNLHDFLEDGERSEAELRADLEKFGERVVAMVEAVTDKPGVNRKERHRNTYPLLAQNKQAVKVKLADRLVNLERGLEEGRGKGDMYVKESGYFRDTLYTPGEAEEWWQEYDRVMAQVRDGLTKSRAV